MSAVIDKISSALHLNKSQATAPSTTSPEFDHTKVTVIYVLGGPGAGVNGPKRHHHHV
jgi:UMP-CMP kinase